MLRSNPTGLSTKSNSGFSKNDRSTSCKCGKLFMSSDQKKVSEAVRIRSHEEHKPKKPTDSDANGTTKCNVFNHDILGRTNQSFSKFDGENDSGIDFGSSFLSGHIKDIIWGKVKLPILNR